MAIFGGTGGFPWGDWFGPRIVALVALVVTAVELVRPVLRRTFRGSARPLAQVVLGTLKFLGRLWHKPFRAIVRLTRWLRTTSSPGAALAEWMRRLRRRAHFRSLFIAIDAPGRGARSVRGLSLRSAGPAGAR